MPLRWVATGAVIVTLSVGCAGAPSRRSSESPVAADPYRWDRAMCRLGVYPAEVDARALAWARYSDLRARQSGSSRPVAAAAVLSERDAFEARCAAWRAAPGEADLNDATARMQ